MTDAKLAEELEGLRKYWNGSLNQTTMVDALDHIELELARIIAALRKDAAGQVLEGAAHTDHPMRHYDRTCPACNFDAPTLSELSAKAGDSLMANARFMDDLLNAYRSGRLREIGEGEVVVPREPTTAMLDALTDRMWADHTIWTVWRAMLAAKEGK